MRGQDDIGRDHSEIKAVNQAQRDADAAQVYASDRQASLNAGMKAAMANSINESHLAGGKEQHGKASNAIGDDVLDAAASAAKGGMDKYAAEMVASQGVESKYLNPTMQQSVAEQAKGPAEAQQFAIQQDTQGRNAGRGLAAGAVTAELSAPMPKDNTEHTVQAAQNGIMGKGNPVTGEKGGLANALSQARESGAIGGLANSGAKMGGPSLFGDGGKGLAAPATPGMEQAQQKSSMGRA